LGISRKKEGLVYRNIREIPRPAGEASRLRNAKLNNKTEATKSHSDGG